jgi:membrane protein implicated in regulation of membrane protease activity
MLIFYIASLVVGGVLVLLGAFGVTKEGDAGVDSETGFDKDFTVDKEFDKDFNFAKDLAIGKGSEGFAKITEAADKELWIPFLSLRFWTYLAAGFGLVGTLGTIMGGNSFITALSATIVGLIAGLAVSYASYKIRQSETSSNVSEQELLGKEAQVLVRISGTTPGRVRLVAMDDIIDMLAVSEDGRKYDVGESVVVVGVENGRLQVLHKDTLYGDQLVIEENT